MTEIRERIPALRMLLPGEGQPVLTVLTFTTSDPFAVHLFVHPRKEAALHHLLAREDLEQAITATEEVGIGDVIVGQTGKRDSFHIVLKHVHGFDGDVELLLRASHLKKLLRLIAFAISDDEDAETRYVESLCNRLLAA